MDVRIKSFTDRLPARMQASLSSDIEAAFGLVSSAKEKAAAINADAKLSFEGRRAAIKDALSGGIGEHMNQLKSTAANRLETVRGQRAALMPVQPGDTTAVGEMRRAEIRSWLRGMSDAERIRLATTTTDLLIREAIAFSPAGLSGVPEDIKQSVVEAIIQGTHGPKLAELGEDEEALANVEAAVTVAAAEIGRLVEG